MSGRLRRALRRKSLRKAFFRAASLSRKLAHAFGNWRGNKCEASRTCCREPSNAWIDCILGESSTIGCKGWTICKAVCCDARSKGQNVNGWRAKVWRSVYCACVRLCCLNNGGNYCGRKCNGFVNRRGIEFAREKIGSKRWRRGCDCLGLSRCSGVATRLQWMPRVGECCVMPMLWKRRSEE